MSDDKKSGERRGLMGRLRNGLKRTRSGLTEGLANVFVGRKRLDDEMLEELETRLLSADMGIEAAQTVLDGLIEKLGRSELRDGSVVLEALQDEIAKVLKPVEQPLQIDLSRQPFVILTVGVNGAGKTTTIGKLASRYQQQGYSVMIAAGDTFRAAAVEQLKEWGEQINCPVVAQATGADSASVVYDAYEAARARGVDILIADTAGRLHTQGNLMEELRKIRRVLSRQDSSSPHETLLVLDGGNGQNALAQAEKFGEAVNVSGLAVTKLDGTARGGVLLALAQRLQVPVRYVGVGEGVDDLRTFNAKEFATALASE
ncbi:signal recognition particle-docking protein FtsY [Halorhodospira halochloris]|uniref:Signal recognition particle receptor FtsY n=1 Tax=Halorhodospira halochloris TaxID=1052 RepID=A0A0X8X722_HALHR|nr:signal recognition particle-docking protein FtsY [Halorhodospira halochloris]MBK1650685.1 signal recognition particle-docking protein FtsY [Halorhodospira halochloris]MCG5529794.1 signal recognition particle-docking protein FtsY [Halorhodospira halochloris]MCG5548963.1 signal recognition particle-docking protein FtsY [Halorhodospira halochloris]BAU56827.1 signal recognition particle receptor protein FtsY [Halorhodospira halochloris]